MLDPRLDKTSHYLLDSDQIPFLKIWTKKHCDNSQCWALDLKDHDKLGLQHSCWALCEMRIRGRQLQWRNEADVQRGTEIREIKWVRDGGNDLSSWVSGCQLWESRSLDPLKLVFVVSTTNLSNLEVSWVGFYSESLILDWNTQLNVLFIHQVVWSWLCFGMCKVWFLAYRHRLSSLPPLWHTQHILWRLYIPVLSKHKHKETFLLWGYAQESQPLNHNSFSCSPGYLLPTSGSASGPQPLLHIRITWKAF